MSSLVSLILGGTPEGVAGGIERGLNRLKHHQTNHLLIGVTNPLLAEEAQEQVVESGIDKDDYTIVVEPTNDQLIAAAAAEVRGWFSWAKTVAVIDSSPNQQADVLVAKKTI